VAFERELRERITPLALGPLRLMLIRDASGFTAYDAVCPHRGAHLGYGGRVEGETIVCPFHGRRIALGCRDDQAYCVRRYRTLTAGGLVFVLLDEHHEYGLTSFLQTLDATHVFVPGFALKTHAPAAIVVENGFDPRHFQSVHGLQSAPTLMMSSGEQGELLMEGTFHADAFNAAWHGESDGDDARFGFLARIYSPNLCISRLGDGESEHYVISGASPDDDGTATIRVSVAVAADATGRPPSETAIRALLRDSRLAYEQDLMIWEHRVHDAPERLAADDQLILAYYDFCSRFLECERDAPILSHQLR
jgi:nitrite reductase/ring-hydroxylating ferredoxin subunit